VQRFSSVRLYRGQRGLDVVSCEIDQQPALDSLIDSSEHSGRLFKPLIHFFYRLFLHQMNPPQFIHTGFCDDISKCFQLFETKSTWK
jgi:hypothetical protein